MILATPSYGEEMRRLRLELGLSQREVGAIVGVAGETISAWERGDRMGNSRESSKLPRTIIQRLKARIRSRDRRG
jgi:transcriptional regulator with XRE-family HTH domain